MFIFWPLNKTQKSLHTYAYVIKMFIFLSLTDIVMRIVHMLIQCLLIRYCRGLALTVLYTVDTDVTYIFIACIHCFICTVLLNFLFTLIYVHSTLTVLLYTSTCTVHGTRYRYHAVLFQQTLYSQVSAIRV